MPPPPIQIPSQIPQFMTVAVMDYKKLAADYTKITDESLKASYKAVLEKKLSDLRDMLATYNTAALAAINTLQVA
jgi:hypothetical protein